MKILVVEDDKRMAEVLQTSLEEEHYSVSVVFDGDAALEIAGCDQFDLIVMDVMLPGINGWEVTHRLRSAQQRMPILMLTARDAPGDVVQGLDSGADDYLTKPFSLEVFFARVRALARRSSESSATVLRVADLVLHIYARRAIRGSREISLTTREFRLLEVLMRHHGRVATRQTILNAVWGSTENVEDNTLDAFIRLLRRKVDGGEPVKLIHTLHGRGYSLETSDGQ
jgi:two-component system copper resistance phosphate regulon response regulator CusR